MANSPTLADLHTPICVELDEVSWTAYLDSVDRWLDNVSLLQASFREQALDVEHKLKEPHMKQLLADIAHKAGEHEQRLRELYAMIGRDASRARRAMGTLVGKAGALQADLVGLAGGASAPWRDMQQLYLAGTNAQSAFAAAEQLGYALGLPDFAKTCFDVVAQKHTQQLLLEELLLEMVPWAILYKTSF
jgi:hypothetical protein